MQITFRQGIISAQRLPPFLNTNGVSISLDASVQFTQIAFCHGNANYLFVEQSSIPDAWQGPFDEVSAFWLYWDINLLTAARSFGFTTLEPGYGPTFPVAPVLDQHFFNTTTTTMYFWNGQDWVECVRVFAGSLIDGGLSIMSNGTQGNINMPIAIGEIVFDTFGNPIKRFTDGSFEFLTTIDVVQPTETNLSSIYMANVDLNGYASTYIPKYYTVKAMGRHGDNIIIAKASYFDTVNAAFAITSDNMDLGSVKQLITHGFIQDVAFDWRLPPLTPLFVGGDGEITPNVNNLFSIQRIGHVVNTNTIFINIERQIIMP